MRHKYSIRQKNAFRVDLFDQKIYFNANEARNAVLELQAFIRYNEEEVYRPGDVIEFKRTYEGASIVKSMRFRILPSGYFEKWVGDLHVVIRPEDVREYIRKV